MFVNSISQPLSIYQITSSGIKQDAAQKTESGHLNKNVDKVTISAPAQKKYNEDVVQWANNKYKQDLKNFKEHIDYYGVDFAKGWT